MDVPDEFDVYEIRLDPGKPVGDELFHVRRSIRYLGRVVRWLQDLFSHIESTPRQPDIDSVGGGE